MKEENKNNDVVPDVEEKKPEPEEKTTELITKANEAAERLEKANQEHRDIVTKQEQLKIEETLGGTADAGAPEQTEEQKEIAGAKGYLKGTGFEDILDPPK